MATDAADGPLAGVTVVDLSRVLAGPFATMVLADLGATVIKVERPGVGDDSRSFGPFVNGESAYFASINRGKRSIALDLKVAEDRVVFGKLLEDADVLVENFRPGAMKRLGYGFDDLSARFPRLVYAAISGFGQTGPYADRAAYDMVVQAMGGIMSITGPNGGPPTRVGSSIGDITAALFAAVGIATALFERERTGRGRMVDVGMLDCQVSILENALARYSATGTIPGPIGSRHPSITPFGTFKTLDREIAIAAGNDALFSQLAHALGAPHLVEDARFATNDLRCMNEAALTEEIERTLGRRRADDWVKILLAAKVPCGLVNDVRQVVEDPHVEARNMVIKAVCGDGATALRVAGNPIKMASMVDVPEKRVPALDEDRADVLERVGRKQSGGRPFS